MFLGMGPWISKQSPRKPAVKVKKKTCMVIVELAFMLCSKL
jgi:hypothetical protein